MVYLLTGILAGFLHVLSGADHLSAVAPLSVDNGRSSWKTGFTWGVGHTSGVFLVGILAIIGKGFIPLEFISSWSERVIGVVLVGIGVWGMRKLLTQRIHTHIHEHDNVTHMHIHVHSRSADHLVAHAHEHIHAALPVGFIHGIAGSSHLFGVLPALALPSTNSAVFYLAGFGAGTILAMTFFSFLIGIAILKLSDRVRFLYRKTLLGFSLLAVGTGIFWIVS